MPFVLPPLPYAPDALEPFIDKQTMEIHHDRHHQAYVTGLNKALEGHLELQKKTVEELLRTIEQLPNDIQKAVRNHGGGHANHSMFWEIMGPKTGGAPGGTIGEAIRSSFGSFDAFKDQFSKAGKEWFGSGWVWVVESGSGLAIMTTANQDSPLMDGKQPIMGLDLWEHAYYLKYQNKRPDYVDAWWNIVNWSAIEARRQQPAAAGASSGRAV